jgi:hypothetical protein
VILKANDNPAAGRPPAPRRIWLCADDYGIAPGVNRAIRDLMARGRINATSVMVVAPSCRRAETDALAAAQAPAAAIGLHLTLTAPFVPLSKGYGPTDGGRFLTLPATMRAAFFRRLDRGALAAEVAEQLRAFADAFGRPPDFIDGHQHVQLFPQARDAVLQVAKALAPGAWLRQCGRASGLAGWRNRKALVLDVLSAAFRRRARRLGLLTNPAFAGAYDFSTSTDFAALFAGFLHRLPAGGVVMCHPGFVDAELERLDPLTTPREREYAFLAGEECPRMLAAHGVVLA